MGIWNILFIARLKIVQVRFCEPMFRKCTDSPTLTNYPKGRASSPVVKVIYKCHLVSMSIRSVFSHQQPRYLDYYF